MCVRMCEGVRVCTCSNNTRLKTTYNLYTTESTCIVPTFKYNFDVAILHPAVYN